MLNTILSGAVGAAIVTGLFSLVKWFCERQAKKNDDAAAEKAEQEDTGETILKRLNALDEKLNALDAKLDESIAVACRTRILRFGDELQHGQRHSEEHFKQTLIDIGEYEKYCATHPDFKNHITSHTTEKIIEIYKQCDKDNSFLK